MLVVFEDLHWIDSETQALLDSLVESLPTARLLLLVNYRPEYRHAWGSKTYYRQLHIDPLPPESADVLLHGLLGGDAGARTRCGPSSFLAPGATRSSSRRACGPWSRPASWSASAEPTIWPERPASIQIPDTVQAVLAARIDRLPPEEKRLLQCAAAVGKDVPFSVLTAIADGPESELRRRLVNLQAAEFLYEARLFPDLEYVFKHALTQEVAYAGLTSDRRRALDTAIVGVLEAAGGRASRRTRGALGAPRVQGRELVQGGHLPSAGGRQGVDAVCLSSSHRPFRAGAARPRPSTGRARHAASSSWTSSSALRGALNAAR